MKAAGAAEVMKKKKPPTARAYAKAFWQVMKKKKLTAREYAEAYWQFWQPPVVLAHSEAARQEYWFTRQPTEPLGAERFDLQLLLEPDNKPLLCAALDETIETLEQGALPQGTFLELTIVTLMRYRTRITGRRGRKPEANYTRDQHIVYLITELQEKFGISPTRNRDQKRDSSGCSIVAEVTGETEQTVENIWRHRVRNK
jgi:hypothetical protein